MRGAKVSEGHAERTRIRLELDVFPWPGTLRLAEIEPPDLLGGRAALRVLWRLGCGWIALR